MGFVGNLWSISVSEPHGKWNRPGAKESLRERFLDFRARQEAAGDFNLRQIADDIGIPYYVLKGFAKDPKKHSRATMPRTPLHLDAIARYLDRLEGKSLNDDSEFRISHPTLKKLFAARSSADFIISNADYRGMYVGMGIGRKSPKLCTSILVMDKRDDRLDYVEQDTKTNNKIAIEGHCLWLTGSLVLLGVRGDMETMQCITLRSDVILADGNRVLVGAEYNTGWPARGSSIATVVFLQVWQGGLEGDLAKALAGSETFRVMREAQGHEGLPEDIAWERVGNALRQIMDGDVAMAGIDRAREFIGPFDRASDLI